MHGLVLICFIAYTILLFLVTWITSRRATNDSFFTGNRRSPWFVVAYGMIGASLSGVTFMSVPGWVNTREFSYMLTVVGFFIGYLIISLVLMPLYYRLNLTTIYTYLDKRFGVCSHKTGSFFFLLSRILGASLRMFLVIAVLQEYVFSYWGVPMELTVVLFLLLILGYTFKGGIKTIIWTDTLQTTFMLSALVISFFFIAQSLDLSFGGMFSTIARSDYSQVIFTDPSSRLCWWKQILGGMFICISMTGLDQEMMQKNLSCRNLKSAQKNMLVFSLILIMVNFLFLSLGAALYVYAETNGINIEGDRLFSTIAIQHLGPVAGAVFVIGLISALYPSADGALTSLTTAFCVDFLNMESRSDWTERKKEQLRYLVHTSFAILFMGVIIFYQHHQTPNLIDILYQVASITYGPLLGLFAFGLFSKRPVQDKWVPVVCIIAPLICFILNNHSEQWFGYAFDFELLLVNGLLTCTGLYLIGINYNPKHISTLKQ